MSDSVARSAVLKALTQRHPNQDHTATVDLVNHHLAKHIDTTAQESHDLGYRYGKAAAFGALWDRSQAEGDEAVRAWLVRVGFPEVFGDAHCVRCHGYDNTAPHDPSHTIRSIDRCPACTS